MPAVPPCLVLHLLTDILLFFTLVATSVFGILAAFRLHRKRDPARRVFTWVKITWLLLTLAAITDFIEIVVVTTTSRLYVDWQTAVSQIAISDDKRFRLLAVLMLSASCLAHLLNVLTEILICLTIASLICCIRIAVPHQDKNSHPLRRRWSRNAAYAASILLALIALTVFSINIYSIAMSGIAIYSNPSAWIVYSKTPAVPVLDFICQICLLLISSCLMLRAFILNRRLRAIKYIRNSLKFLLVCCFLSTLRTTYDVISTIILYSHPIRDPHNTTFSAEEFLSVIFVTWPAFIILVILYYLGIDTKSPLCSEGHPLLDTQSHTVSSDSFTAAESDFAQIPEHLPLETQSHTLSSDSPTASRSDVILMTQPSINTIMTQPSINTIMTPTSENPENLFSCDGLVDAPPSYSPPAQHQAAASLPSSMPLITTQVPAPTSQATQPDAAVQAELRRDEIIDSTQPVVSTTQDTAIPQLAAEPMQSLSPSPENNFPMPVHDEAMGLYHQADGRPPGLTGLLPSHEETLGLYHQADGRPPGMANAVSFDDTNANNPSQVGGPIENGSLPSHDEVMGLYHQADGRVPDSDVIPCLEKDKKEKK